MGEQWQKRCNKLHVASIDLPCPIGVWAQPGRVRAEAAEAGEEEKAPVGPGQGVGLSA